MAVCLGLPVALDDVSVKVGTAMQLHTVVAVRNSGGRLCHEDPAAVVAAAHERVLAVCPGSALLKQAVICMLVAF